MVRDFGYRITRSSPTRLVTRSRSRYSSSGIAYLRVTPVRSLNATTFSFGSLGLLRDYQLAQGFERVAMEDQVVGELDQHAIAQQQGDDLLGAGLVDAQRCQHFF